MKYKCYKKQQKEESKGGDYWRDFDFSEHLKLTSYQTTYLYTLENFLPPRKVLEAGCGLGRWVVPLSKKNYMVTGIEIEKDAIDIINKNYKAENLTLVHGDIFKMIFPDKSFDLVISLGVLEHFENPEVQIRAIAEHIRVLKDDGIFLVTVPHFSLLRLLFHVPFVYLVSMVRAIKKKKQYFGEYRYSKNAFKKILKTSGLQIVDIVYDELLPPYNFGLTVDYPLKRIFKAASGEAFKANKTGIKVFYFLWGIHPALVSGGIGFVTKKIL
jgi:SAM-dependent methyltransferase